MPSFSRKLINPILRKDVKIQARSMKFAWSLFAYEMVLAVIFALSMAVISEVSGSDYKSVVSLFPIIAIAQLGIIALVVPIVTASSISGERERQTFDILLMTPLSPFRIVFGKVTTAVVRVMFFVIGSVPIMAISFTYGGMSWGVLFLFILLCIVYAFFLGSIGIFCSTISRKAILCVLLAFGFYAVLAVIAIVPNFVFLLASDFDYVWEMPLFMMTNPVLIFLEFFYWAMTGEGISAEFGDFSDRMDVMGPVSSFVLQKNVMIIFNILGLIGISILMMKLSARRIDPVRSSKRQEKRFAKMNAMNQPMQMQMAPGPLMQPMQAPMMGQPLYGGQFVQGQMMNQAMMGQPMQGQMMNSAMMGQPMQGQMMNQAMMGQPMQGQMMNQAMMGQSMQGQMMNPAMMNQQTPEVPTPVAPGDSRFAPPMQETNAVNENQTIPGGIITK
ncbi:MAG: ABC transporter permease subunit [Lachnospiraceae bacterium]|nr:ABC transporter permease subunit [Lachnospiraceae bacterium]